MKTALNIAKEILKAVGLTFVGGMALLGTASLAIAIKETANGNSEELQKDSNAFWDKYISKKE